MSEEFFEVQEEEKPKKKKTTVEYSCERCGLCNQANTKDFSYVGEGKKKILIVGEMPSLKEDGFGNLGMGPEFNFLKDHFKENGIYIFQDCWYTTAIRCRPYAGKQPNQVQIKSCQEKLEALITELKPKLIILLGELPFKSVIYPHLRGRIGGTQWTMFMGEIIPDQDRETYLAPISDPAYLLSKKRYSDGNYSKPLYEREPGTYLLWKQQLAKILSHNNTFYKTNYISDCISSTKIEDAMKWLEEALDWEYVAFDFETTGIKPHRKGHRIVCVSISNGMYSFGFPFFEDREFRRAWKRLMLSDVKKIAHNAMFENMWNHALLGYYVDGWEADTMLLAHAYNSVKPCGLKFLTYVNFGVIGYDDSADPFLKATQEEADKWGTNAFNRINEAPIDDLIQYCAMDSLFTYKLWEMMKGQFSEFQNEGNKFFLESAITLCKAQENGFRVDMEIFEQNRKYLLSLQEGLEDNIMKDPDVKKWDGSEAFNFKSNKQLSHLLFDILGVKPQGFTKGGAPAVDKEILPKYDVPFIKHILAWRRLEKIQQALDTYMKEAIDGKIHSFTRLHGVDTMRSSMSDVNLQNNFKRDKEASGFIRTAMKPSKGHKLVAWDYKSLEVMIGACHSQDPNMMRYVTDSTTDMHRDSAKDCFLLDDVPKDVRQEVKGSFVFAEMYGSYWGQVAVDLWEFAKTYTFADGTTMKQHLASKGIRTYEQFEKHIQKAEDILWQDRFPVHAKWRREMTQFYNDYGYVMLPTGFMCKGPMRKNNTFNTPVQGSAYHVCQWTMNKVQEEIEKRELNSRLLCEIHDCIVADVDPAEEAILDEIVWYWGTQGVKEHWPWITVELQMEREESEIDGSWAKMGNERMIGKVEFS